MAEIFGVDENIRRERRINTAAVLCERECHRIVDAAKTGSHCWLRVLRELSPLPNHPTLANRKQFSFDQAGSQP